MTKVSPAVRAAQAAAAASKAFALNLGAALSRARRLFCLRQVACGGAVTGGDFRAARPLSPNEEDDMRSNSGKDEARNNMHDPTMRDRDLGRGDTSTTERKPKAPADHRTGRKD